MPRSGVSRGTVVALWALLWLFVATALWLPLTALSTSWVAESKRTERVTAMTVLDRRWDHGRWVAEFPVGRERARVIVANSDIRQPGDPSGRNVGLGSKFTLFVEPGQPDNFSAQPTDPTAWGIRYARQLVAFSPAVAALAAGGLLLGARRQLRWLLDAATLRSASDASNRKRRLDPRIDD